MDVMVGCELCGSPHNLQRCSKCKTALYCSREHQKAHWQEHRLSCGQLSATKNLLEKLSEEHLDRDTGVANTNYYQVVESNIAGPASDIKDNSYSQNLTTTEDYLEIFRDDSSVGDINQIQLPTTLSSWFSPQQQQQFEQRKYLPADQSVPVLGWQTPPVTLVDYPSPSSSTTSSSSAVSNKQIFDSHQPEYMSLPSDLQNKIRLGGQQTDSYPYHHRNKRLKTDDMPHMNNSSLFTSMCNYVISDMDKYGICVIDDFLGKNLGMEVLEEVKNMYRKGQFMDGQVVNNTTGNSSQTIRGDKIIWVDGHEAFAYSIGILIKMVDKIVISCNRMPNNGKLGKYVISDRTKAMIACYPGKGTKYVKHVDNPNKDGRCITSIYYLNENWDVKKDGGLLRIFPTECAMQVADIEPLFDRMLFFWSDRRNPHEVQASLRTRYAITLWYNDKGEKTEASKLHDSTGHQSSGASPEIR